MNSLAGNIVLFLTTVDGGGVERAFINLAEAFIDGGTRVTLVLGNRSGYFAEQISPHVPVVELMCDRTLQCVIPLARYLRAARPAFCLTGMEHCNFAAIAAARLAGNTTAVIATVHIHPKIYSDGSGHERFMPTLMRLFYPFAKRIVCVSDGVADAVAAITRLPTERIAVIPNAVVSKSLLAKATVPFNHPWFGASEPPVILGVGRLVRQKRFDVLIKAFAILRQSRSARLLILGEGDERPALESLAESLGLKDSIALPGFEINPYPYMANASVFAQSSDVEGFGIVLAEAMACGTPVVATDCPSGPAEILGHGQWGRLVPPGDTSALAEALSQVLGEKSNTQALKARSEIFRVDQVVEAYLNLFTVAARNAT